jgi:ribosome-associated heat shock protein Hsp15
LSQESGQRGRQRIDKWLWHARVVRTRTAAAALATVGFVRVNGKRTTSASHSVRIGDVVTVALDRSVRVVRIERLCDRRGDAQAARTLYRDLTTSSGTGACTFSGADHKVSAPPR